MAVTSEVVAGDCVKHASAKKDGADQDIDDIEHWLSPVSNKAASCGGHVALQPN
jgi:hypothetical protein